MKALGVDVGLRKGLDLVLLDGERRVLDVAPKLPHARFRDIVLDWAPDAVAIDSPPRWATPTGMRETERLMFKLGIGLYKTPAEDARRPFHDWMIAGMDAFHAIEDRYPLFKGDEPQMKALEVFPHASSVVFCGGLRPPEHEKHGWRRAVLEKEGIEPTRLRSPDLIDAALAGLTAIYALEGCYCWLGKPDEGVIVLPCMETSLPSRFQRLIAATSES